MFTRKPTPVEAELEKVVNALIERMSEVDQASKEYAQMADQLVKLRKLQETPARVSPDTWAIIAANLAGILLILGYEKAGVITSKALSFVKAIK